MCYCDGTAPAIYEADIVKARKSWRCCECLDLIAIGEKYERVNGLWEGHWSRFETCMDCVSMRDELECSCYPHGLLMDYIDPRGSERAATWHERREANYQRLQGERLAATT